MPVFATPDNLNALLGSELPAYAQRCCPRLHSGGSPDYPAAMGYAPPILN